MDQDMNAYLEQLRARAEKRLQDSGANEKTVEKPTEAPSEIEVETPVEVKELVESKPSFNAETSIDELMKELLPDMSEPTKPFEVKPEDLDEESAQMMEDLVAWANRDPTIPFEPISEEDATELHEIVSELVDDAPSNPEPDKTAEFEPATEPEKTKSFKVASSEEPETGKKSSVFKSEKENEPKSAEDDEDVEKPDSREQRREEARARREEKRRARELRKALVDKENGASRGLIGEILYVILFVLLVAVTILAVLYLLQTIAGIKIIDVESLFDLVFHWISNKILK